MLAIKGMDRPSLGDNDRRERLIVPANLRFVATGLNNVAELCAELGDWAEAA